MAAAQLPSFKIHNFLDKMDTQDRTIDPKSGFCYETQIYHSLNPKPILPRESTKLSVATYALSLFNLNPLLPSLHDSPALINSSTGEQITYTEFTQRVNNLASSLHQFFGLSNGDTAFILSPNSPFIPILYFSLFSLGVIVSPANPASTKSELAYQIHLSKPVIAFTTSSNVHKLTGGPGTVLIDSPEFESLMSTSNPAVAVPDRVEPNQSDVAAILYSSGTTGKVKGVAITHRNMIALVSYMYHTRQEKEAQSVVLYTVPLFHVYGFSHCLKCVALGECMVLMERFEMREMLRVVEKFRVKVLAVAPPVIVALVKKSSNVDGGLVGMYDLSSLERILCGGAPLGKDVIAALIEKFPNLTIAQGYGLTETFAAVFRPVSKEDTCRWGSTGRLIGCCEAKIVDPQTWKGMPPCIQGELWIRGPTIMKGYIGNQEVNRTTLVSDGWLRTGDLCYIDAEGYLYVVDRLKEVIKYKGYQVAPAELEQLLQSHPDIVDAAVIPYPDEDAGEIPMAFVVRRPESSLNEAQIMDTIAKQVAPYKKIRRLAFVDSIPKSAAGKIMRMELRKIAAAVSLNCSSKL